MQPRSGLTLVELLVVLVILSVLTVVAVQATDTLLDQGRFDATQRTLQEIRQAITGTPSQATFAGVAGFAADLGRLPISLDELLVNPTSGPGMMFNHAVQTFDSDGDGTADVALATGWRGPYLRLAPGAATTNFRDGWGNPFNWMGPAGSNPNLLIRSFGSDGQADPPSDGYKADVAVVIQPQDWQSKLISFRVYELDTDNNKIDPNLGTDTLEVRIYGANSSTGQATLITPAVAAPFQYTLVNRAIGPLAVRAVRLNGTTVVKRSAVFYWTVTPQSDHYQELILR